MFKLSRIKSITYSWPVRMVASAAKPSYDQSAGINRDPASHFRHARIGNFFQDQPVLHNPYVCDSLLKSYLKRTISKQHYKEIDEDLTTFGERVSKELVAKGRECEVNPPTLKQYDAWGKRVDQIETCESWRYMKKVVAEEGLVAIGYERKYGEASRIYQMAKNYLFSPSSGLYSCPLSMTDGAAKVFESVVDDLQSDDDILAKAYRQVISRDPEKFCTSGQWMTERGGGSDVANGTETVAIRQPDGSFHLHGYKWFTSATDADMALTLARIADENGDVTPGSRGLSLFFLETRGEHGKRLHSGLNGLQVQRLKDKLGTRQLPTAEMLLDGTVAYQVGPESHGVRQISDMLTITRIHNALSSAADMRHLLHLARDYSCKRTVFGMKLSDNSLHMQTLARMDVEARSAFLLVFELIRLLGLSEAGAASKQDMNVLRILTPVCKLYTAKQALSVASESLESFGGMGYLEDTGIPGVLRDAQVLSIWEGTTNVLSLDVLRAIEKSDGGVLADFFASVNDKLVAVEKSQKMDRRVQSVASVRAAAKSLRSFVDAAQASRQRRDLLVHAARDFSYSIARIYMASLMLEQAAWEGSGHSDIYAAKRYCEKDLCPVMKKSNFGCYEEGSALQDKELVFSSY